MHSVVLSSAGERLDWQCQSFEDLGTSHFQKIADLSPELLVFGSGLRLRFPSAAWIRPLIERGIGIETMDTHAACRTYNILASEGRKVAVALLIEAQ